MIAFSLICLEQIWLNIPLLLGAFLIFSLMKIPNISIETALVCGAATTVRLLSLTQHFGQKINFFVVIIGGLCGGAFIGIITSLLVIYGRLPHLLASILTMGIGYGINLYLLKGSYLSLAAYKNPLTGFACSNHPEFGGLMILAIILVISIIFFLRTQLGLSFAVYGNNPLFFQHYGISSAWIISLGLITSNAFAGLSGYLIAQSSGFVDINAGNGLALFCITVLILGRVLYGKQSSRSVIIPLTGCLVYNILQQLLVRCGMSTQYFTIIQALIVLFVVLLYYRQRSVSELAGDHLGV